MLFEKVLVPVDLSEVTVEQLACVGQLREFGMKQAIVLYVTSDEVKSVYDESKLVTITQPLKESGVDFKIMMESGKAANTILKIAKKEKATMIMMACSGKTKAKELMVGSVSLDVVRRTHIPVLVGKFAGAQPGTCKILLQQVLVSLDLGPGTEKMMNVFKEMDLAGCRSAVLFHVVSSSKFSVEDDAKFQEVKKDLGKWKDSHDGRCSVDTHIHYGTAAYNIMEAAREFDATLIMMGNVGKGLLHSMTLGSVSDEVMRKANAHVLIIPV